MPRGHKSTLSPETREDPLSIEAAVYRPTGTRPLALLLFPQKPQGEDMRPAAGAAPTSTFFVPLDVPSNVLDFPGWTLHVHLVPI